MNYMTGDVHRHQLLLTDKLQPSTDHVSALHLLATGMALDVLGELLPSQLQSMVSEGILDARMLIRACDLDYIVQRISETLWELKPVVDLLRTMSDLRGLGCLEGMHVKLKYCMKKASFVYHLRVFLYTVHCRKAEGLSVRLTNSHLKTIYAQGFAIKSIMDYMCKVAHFFSVDIKLHNAPSTRYLML
jgi:hypothetical protein